MHLDRAGIRTKYTSLAAGSTARENHDGCPSGTDTRRRLYVTKSDDNQQLKVYCHNCGGGAVVNLHGAAPLRTVTPRPPAGPIKLPKMWNGSGTIHPKHRRWLDAYGIDLDKFPAMQRPYSASATELVFPYPNHRHTGYVGYQIRYFDGRDPKWKSDGSPVSRITGGYIFIVEDIISAMKVASLDLDTGYLSLAGHRSALPPQADELFEKAQMVVVWLDNDKPSVVEASQDLAQQSTMLCGRVVLIEGGTDPKRYPIAELKKVRDECEQISRTAPTDGRPYHVYKVFNPGEGVRT